MVTGGEYDPNDPGMRASVDIQYADAIVYPTSIIFYSVGGDSTRMRSGFLAASQSMNTCALNGSATYSESRTSRRQSV